MPALLELDHVGLSYHTLSGEIQALSQISFSVQEGEFVSLVGPSGCRKKYRPESDSRTSDTGTGTITMQGLPREHSVLSVGYMLQKDHLFEWLTIYEMSFLVLKFKKGKQKNPSHTLTVSYRSMGSGTSVSPTLPSFPAGCDNGPH